MHLIIFNIDDDEQDDDEEAEEEDDQKEEEEVESDDEEEEPTIPSKIKSGAIAATAPVNRIIQITNLPQSKLFTK